MKKKVSRFICLALALCIGMIFIGVLSPKSMCYYDCYGLWEYTNWDLYGEAYESGYTDVSLCSGYHNAYVDGKYVKVKMHEVLSGDIVAPVVYAVSYEGSPYVASVSISCKGFEGGPTSVTVPRADDCSFDDCEYLERIEIDYAEGYVNVSNCANLESVDFKKVDGLFYQNEHIGGDYSRYSVFIGGCHKLAELNIKTGESWKIENCDGLKSIQVNNPEQDIEYLFMKDCASLEELIISSNCDYVRVENCPNLKKVMIPNYTSFVFADCKKLENVIIPQGVEQIGDHAFLNCESLKSINLPKSVTRIDSQAFRFTSVRDVYYAGTKAEWENVVLYGEIFDPGTVIHCSDGDYDLCKCKCHKGWIFSWFYEIIAAILEVCGFDSHCRCGNAHR